MMRLTAALALAIICMTGIIYDAKNTFAQDIKRPQIQYLDRSTQVPVPVPGIKNVAYAPTRHLKLYNVHTKEKLETTFWQNGSYNHNALDSLNYFLRDWRANEVAQFDPEVLSLVFYIKRELEKKYPQIQNQPIHIISGYRSATTNNKMKKSGRNVAKKSQHSYGKAVDIHFPGIPASEVRDIALSFKVGGVGYYHANQFVHVDTGRVRQW